ncbi:GNAT family N-acetyltransferase [Neptunomonas antarctica]|uniref:Ribosomal protein S18 acetylase RimI n=1 Tax=Neptunomonas antarctica TaxID=619304 RepID=A0A1N7LYU0_9GAMM|nr:GNAT family N-acetyltransferase [Neptunomonas antarctica]SIS79010.1 Ribosomal protein S18 acetylase RimI [Neptunomonas antarctica]
MEIKFREATVQDSEVIGSLVVELTTEICELTNTKHFDIDLNGTIQRCNELISDGHYAAIIGVYEGNPVAVVTMTETYALYAGGKIGLIQEFYVSPEFRASGVGSMLVEQVEGYGKKHNWSCIELCTPPLPEFERTLNFYQKNGLNPVGGRKMRQALS